MPNILNAVKSLLNALISPPYVTPTNTPTYVSPPYFAQYIPPNMGNGSSFKIPGKKISNILGGGYIKVEYRVLKKIPGKKIAKY